MWVKEWCRRNRVKHVTYKSSHKKGAGTMLEIERTQRRILEEFQPDLFVAFPGKKYVRLMILAAMRLGIETKIVREDRWELPYGY